MDCRLASLSVPRFRLLPAAIVVLPPSPVFTTWAAVRFTSRPAAAVSEPPAPETYKPATRLTLVRLPWEFWLSRVVDTTLSSRSAVAVRLLSASILPPRLSRSTRARTTVSSPEMRPPRFFTFSAESATTLRPAIVPAFVKSPERSRSTALPAISAPEPSRSPFLTRT